MFGDRLKELREDMGLSQDDLAEILGVKQSTISSYETNAILPSLDIAVKIADYFSVSLDYLTCRTKIMHNINTLPKISREIVLAIIQILNKYIKL